MEQRVNRGRKTVVLTDNEQATNESKLHAEINDECKRRRWLAFHGSMAHRSRRTIGEPDYVIAAPDGRVFFIEAKTKTGKLSTEQLAVGHLLNALGQRYAVVRSISEFIDFVDKE